MVYLKNIQFEYDPIKSAANRVKHGIDFEEAKLLWNGTILEIEAIVFPEPRSIVLGKILDMYWAAVITRRRDRIRIISVRRARGEEKAAFEKNG